MGHDYKVAFFEVNEDKPFSQLRSHFYVRSDQFKFMFGSTTDLVIQTQVYMVDGKFSMLIQPDYLIHGLYHLLVAPRVQTHRNGDTLFMTILEFADPSMTTLLGGSFRYIVCTSKTGFDFTTFGDTYARND